MVSYRTTLEHIAALAHAGSHGCLSSGEMHRQFTMIEHLANKALYNPGQPRLVGPVVPPVKPKPGTRRPRVGSK